MKIKIRNGLVLLYDGSGWHYEKKDILINGNRIERVGSLPETGEGEEIDASDKLVMPGLINAHTHAYMTIHRNYADDMAFFEWLDRVQRVEDDMTEEDVYWTTLLAVIEMLRSGTTCFVDMTIKSAKTLSGPLSAAAGAARDSGIRAVITRGLAGVSDSEESLMKFGQAVKEMEMFAGEERITFMHGPHAPYSCMADYLKKLTASCRERGIGQTIHLSESRAEMEGCRRDHGTTPIRYVDSLGVFSVPVIAAHCVYASDEDIRLMAEKNVSIAVNPKSNMKLGNGFAPVQRFLDAGINVCLGTDGCGSNNSLNMFAEMNAAGLVYKGASREAKCVGAADVLRMATVNGAAAIGRGDDLGAIREGALADLILLDLNVPQFMPRNNIISGLVYSSTGSETDTVIVDGRVLMKGRKLTTVDEKEVYGKCAAIAERLGMGKAVSV